MRVERYGYEKKKPAVASKKPGADAKKSTAGAKRDKATEAAGPGVSPGPAVVKQDNVNVRGQAATLARVRRQRLIFRSG